MAIICLLILDSFPAHPLGNMFPRVYYTLASCWFWLKVGSRRRLEDKREENTEYFSSLLSVSSRALCNGAISSVQVIALL
jgi:hypothetical protein